MPWVAPALALLACRDPQPARPNVLLVTLDTTRADVLGAYGASPSPTPRLDALAAAGVRFDRAYTVTPLTIPAHSSVHTGLVPLRHGVRDNGDGWLPPAAVTLAERLHDAGYATMASVGAEVTSRHWGFDQGFDAYFDDLDPDAARDRWRAERPGEAVVDDAVAWIATTRDRPWFAWVHLFDAHYPYAAPEPFRAAHADPYRAEIAHLDAVVGTLLDAVPADTVVLVLADHGEARGDHGEATHGALVYDATTRVPWIVAGPGIAARAVDAPVSLVDVAPTVLGLAGAPPLPDVDGVDLAPVLRGEGADPGRAVLVESLYGWLHFGWAPQRAWVDAGHKLVHSATPELYARADAAEAHDLAGAEPERVRAMTVALDTFRSTRAPSAAPGAVDDAHRAQLAALGYVAPDPVTERDPPPDGLLDARRGLPGLVALERARQAHQHGDDARAEALLRELLADDAGVIDARLMLAGLLRARGETGEALTVLDGVSSPRARTMAGAVLLQRGEIDEARAELEQALARDPGSAVAWDVLLTALQAQGDPSTDARLAEALALLPADPQLLAHAALRDLLQGHAADEAALERALALGPHPFWRYAQGLAAARRGDPAAAEQAWLAEVAAFGPAVPARRALVTAYAAQGRYEEQLEQLDAIAVGEPPRVDTLHSRAQALFNLRRYAEAEAAVDACRAFDPGYAPCGMLAANVYDKLGQPDRARAAYDEALRLARPSP